MAFQDQMREMFCDLISEFSEENWCAGWLINIEKDIRDRGGKWVTVAHMAGGWPLGYYGVDGWDPLTEEELEQVDWEFIISLMPEE